MTTVPRPGDARLAILLYLTGVFFFAVNDALGKWLVTDYGVAELMAVRSLGAIAVLAPTLWAMGTRFASRPRWGWQAVRVLCSSVDTFCFYASTKLLPLADAMTFYLAAPLIVTALSSALLRERVGVARWLGVVAGFAGVLIALRPTEGVLSAGALVALLGATMFACTVLITRTLRGTPWVELVTYQFIGSGIVGAVLAPFHMVMPSPGDVGLMALVGIVSMGCFICITKALAMAPASLLMPFQYTSLVWGALLGWLVFGDTPAQAVIWGGLVIVASGLFVLRRAPAEAAA